jgi:hypothetical protein
MSTILGIENFENGNNFSDVLTGSEFEEPSIDLFHKATRPRNESNRFSSMPASKRSMYPA